jgi:monofunctional biosynthetic peptidoglycan transglycosylase
MRRRLARLFLAALAALAALGIYVWAGLPARSDVQALATTNPGPTALMRQRAREAQSRARKVRPAWSWVPLSAVSRHLIQAVLAAEDQKFFGHEGIDWEAVQMSIEKDVRKRRFARGGSTITQQLAKNLFFGTSKTPTRKLRELLVARWLEEDLSKARILALYLNVIEWGDGIYGCKAAALHWYGKPASDLTASEAAGLAAMIPNPRRLNPRVSAARHERATRRVLWLMARAGYLGRDVAGLGAEPPPEPVEEDEGAPADEPATTAPTEGSAAAPPEPAGSPSPASPMPPLPPSTPSGPPGS